MYVVDGIAYADNQTPEPLVCGVRPLDDFTLWLRFSSGEARRFDLKPLLQSPAFAPLADPQRFKEVYIDYGVLVWMDGAIDIAPDYLYAHSIPLDSASA